MSAQRVRVTLTVVLADDADADIAAEQIFDLVASDPLDLAPLVAEVETFDMETVE